MSPVSFSKTKNSCEHTTKSTLRAGDQKKGSTKDLRSDMRTTPICLYYTNE